MKLVCYFAEAEGSHPHCSTSDYDKMWPVMQGSVERLGYELIHLTSMVDKARTNIVHRVDIDPKTVMFSREVAWLDFLRKMPDGEQAVLIEPDAFLLRRIPPLREDRDILFLRRPGRTLPSGFRIAKKAAIPFYEAVVALYSTYSDEEKVFHGDCRANQSLLGLGKHGAFRIPSQWNEVRIETRNWLEYTSKLWRNAVAWNFKGTSKHIMLDMANGIYPELR